MERNTGDVDREIKQQEAAQDAIKEIEGEKATVTKYHDLLTNLDKALRDLSEDKAELINESFNTLYNEYGAYTTDVVSYWVAAAPRRKTGSSLDR